MNYQGQNSIDSNTSNNVVIVGAGIAGLATGILLSKQGYKVDIFEKLPDIRSAFAMSPNRRSINFTISERGVNVLRTLGVFEKIQKLSVPLKGRIVHKVGYPSQFQQYGIKEDQVLYSITRTALLSTLVNLAEENNVKILFNHTCNNISPENNEIKIFNNINYNLLIIKNFNFIIGADGTFSKVRKFIHNRKPSVFYQEYSEYFYKEALIPINKQQVLQTNCLHVWPCQSGVIVAMPNADLSFTVNLILNIYSKFNFEILNSENTIKNFFNSNAPQLLEYLPYLTSDILNNRSHSIVTNKMSSWYYKNKIILVGDACHAVAPFLGQGMNAALEDSLILTELIRDNPMNVENAFEYFQLSRKIDTDLLAQFSNEHLTNLKYNSSLDNIEKKIDKLFYQILGNRWIPFYTLLAHTTVRYSVISKKIKIQSVIKNITMLKFIFYTFFCVKNLIYRIIFKSSNKQVPL